MSFSREKKVAWHELIDSLIDAPYLSVVDDAENFVQFLHQAIEDNNVNNNKFSFFINVCFFLQPERISLLRKVFDLYCVGTPYSLEISQKIILDSFAREMPNYSFYAVPLLYTTDFMPERSGLKNAAIRQLLASESFKPTEYGKLRFVDALISLQRRKTFSLAGLYMEHIGYDSLILKAVVVYRGKRRINAEEVSPFKLPEDTAWEDITIKFINIYDIEIFVGKNKFAHSDYEQMGFFDKKSKAKKADKVWGFFQKLSTVKGVYTLEGHGTVEGKDKDKYYKSVLNRKLKAIFGLLDDPISFSKASDGISYKTKFVLLPTPELFEDPELRPRNVTFLPDMDTWGDETDDEDT